MRMNLAKESIKLHLKKRGKLEINSKIPLKNKLSLSLAYTPGVAAVSLKIKNDKRKVYPLTIKQNSVAVVSDGSAVLGLGNIGPEAALPVMEGKCAIFKEFAGIDAFPICLATQNSQKIIETVERIAPVFGGINLEDIAAPKCFEIEKTLIEKLDIPVFHDDQHGTAIVVLAGLINALKIVKKKKSQVEIVINGAGAAGLAVVRLLLKDGFKKIYLLDTQGLIWPGRPKMNAAKKEVARLIFKHRLIDNEIKKRNLDQIIKNKDIFIGVSTAGILTADMVASMAKDQIIFAMANPVPEIMPDLARKAGAKIIATGRSDFPNQINNALVFPGIFRGALDGRKKKITEEMKIKAAYALATLVKKPTAQKFIPQLFDKRIVKTISDTVKNI